MNCKTCKSRCTWAGQEASEHGKCFVGCTPMTNYDRFISKTPEELAAYLNDMQGVAYISGLDIEPIRSYPNNYVTWLDWLKQEVKDD